ncbi:hypothetical protein EJ05DRAFT_500956 [Pseudovirgaria hyperparasitica]|uniref:Uncharacterized protein n=1 Tax=Pseudovirgaria hyperparasitica TaxID=470096 RepID=A0A6A6W5H2_9PEZI|nr:uncharacterized protein EJ05DRAFT_500956 [Pseudovirgaria hyperparasitica]KAF2757419.1 hypothetical protein EJ05DRAFT_500956 [Pseudovirgaria hyperparasitica]
MAPTPRQPPHTRKPNPHKRAKLPTTTKITKRPLPHPPLPTPHSTARQTIYLRPTTPFIPTIKRIRTLLAHIAARRTQALIPRRGTESLTAAHVETVTLEELRRGRSGGGGGSGSGGAGTRADEAVYVRASGRAIERALGLARWFLERGEGVRVRTGTVGAVDDLVVCEEGEGDGDGDGDGDGGGEGGEEARVRYINFVEVAVSAR